MNDLELFNENGFFILKKENSQFLLKLNVFEDEIKNFTVKFLNRHNIITPQDISKEKLFNELIPKLYFEKPKIASKLYDNLNDLPIFKKLLLEEEILNKVSEILNTEESSLITTHFQFFIHIPHEEKHLLGWHQDSSYYKDFDSNNSLVCWIPINDTDKFNGGISAIPKSHKAGELEHIKNEFGTHKAQEKEKKGLVYIPQEAFNRENSIDLKTKKGDIAFFDFNLIHKSIVTKSNTTRYTVLARFGVKK
ncbi:protein involved in biosynthesis of mitomycin antibiotics/polyketide fumonisin [Thiovulum sp. ES]|nr:protein involved in biosynthesis of mitomycin antibiotics/polyketide fumonisin [Thiovulum sp. ES]